MRREGLPSLCRAGRGRTVSIASFASCIAVVAAAAHLDVLRVHADVPLLAPTITSISGTGGSSSGGETVTVNGTNFDAGLPTPNVLFNGTPATQVTVLSNTQLTAVTPPMCPGNAAVQVNDVAGTSNSVNYSYTSPQPSVTALSPATGSSDGPTQVTITGSNLYCPKTVAVGNVPATVVTSGVTNTPTTLTVSIPAQPGNTVGDVVVTPQIGPASTTTAADRFTWRALAPVLSSISVSGGPSQGGTMVTLGGDHLAYATTVSFGASPARVVSSTDQQISVQSRGRSGDPGCLGGSAWQDVPGRR